MRSLVTKSKRTPEERENSRIYGLIRSALRRAWLRFPARIQALQAARYPYVGDNTRQKWCYQCMNCDVRFKLTEVAVDHITPCGTFLKAEDWATFGPNLFCEVDKLQILCKSCHSEKTKEERKK